ncbi:hypothetical protein E2L06_04345 [Haloterrigena sp. H1]|uniref:cupredoxin domain-containing protein n=1 Tax=Haloterrigena sp. H1 TaxID=2552943 RepID=UPI00110D8F75|nr:cupredoxin domain-containing protein [Haloterrigena sp. H1]TMT85862.1 hypothetical protein E2L06_04345 [Haloterrigena sp. H1]
MNRRTILTATGGMSTLFVTGCLGGSGPVGEETTDVSMEDEQFDPRNVHADTDATITWTNEGETRHTVTAASDNWEKDSEVPDGAETTHTFGESGVYDVYCSIHGDAELSGMSMKVSIGDATIENPLGDGSDADGGGYY